MKHNIATIRTSEKLTELNLILEEINWTDPKEAAQKVATEPCCLIERKAVTDSRLLQKWEQCQTPISLTAEALILSLQLLSSTTLGESVRIDQNIVQAALPSLGQQKPRPTAAHPRAYAGTHEQQPKAATPKPLQLQTILCDPVATRALLQQTSKFVDDALAKMSCAERVQLKLLLPHDCRLNADHFDHDLFEITGFFGIKLPLSLRLFLWPVFVKMSASVAGRVFQLCMPFANGSDDTMLVLVALWLTKNPDENGIRWLEWVMRCNPELRQTTLIVLLTAGFTRLPFSPEHLDWLVPLHAADSPSYAYELWLMLETIEQEVEAGYRRGGIELLHQIGYNEALDTPPLVGDAPVEQLETLGNQIFVVESNAWAWSILCAWKACGEVNGLGKAIEAIKWEKLSLETANMLITLFGSCWPQEREYRQAVGHWLLANACELEDCLHQLEGEYEKKFLDQLAWIIDEWEPALLRTAGGFVVEIAALFSQQPFSRSSMPVDVWNNLLDHVSPHQYQRLSSLSRSVLRAIDDACKRRNNAYLVGAGCNQVGKVVGDELLTFVEGNPRRLFKVARSLGGLSAPQAQKILKVWWPKAKNLPMEESLFQLEQSIAREVMDPLGGSVQLAEDRTVWHAAIIQKSLSENRRGLRQLLKQHIAGNDRYIPDHPLNKRWLQEHSRVNIHVWEEGHQQEVQIDGIGKVKIGFEQDPLEVLQLGTYVGSCLGLGGICSYSAAAIALDINKQVIYCRNARGSVIARQLVAISEEQELVRFEVYPFNVPAKIRRCLIDFSTAFADRMGLPITKNVDYEIKVIIAEDWWDDYAMISDTDMELGECDGVPRGTLAC